jgi:hypothetical protein
MTAYGGLPLTLALMCIGTLVGCGSTSRQITSLTLAPPVANAQSYPDGQVKYSATANYNHPPSTAPIQPALWAIQPPQNVQGTATISQNGVAKCGAGAAGNFTVLAYAIADPNTPQTNQNLLKAKKAALGLAQLSCP